MPFGPNALGVAYFTGVKLVGYSLAGLAFNRGLAVTRPHPLTFGVTRAAVGVAVGASYGYVLYHLPHPISNSELTFYAGLIPIRILEWLFVLWLFYRTAPTLRPKVVPYVAGGVGWSFALDLPAIFAAFSLPGGFWVC